MLRTALSQTAPLWPPIATAFAWVHQVATLLDNDRELDGDQMRGHFEQLLQQIEQDKEQAGSLSVIAKT